MAETVKQQHTEYTIDATGERLGRVATKIAVLLMGKNSPLYRRNIVADTTVTVVNVSQLEIMDKKKRQKTYSRFSGYPSGLKKETLGRLIDRSGYGEALRRAVFGMLPKNKLREKMIKNLRIDA